MTYLQNKVNKGQEWSGKLPTLIKGLQRIENKFHFKSGQRSSFQFLMAYKNSTSFQFNSSVYLDECSYGLDLEREGQAHQKY